MQLDYVVLDQSRWEPVALERYRRMMHVDALMGPLHRHRLTPIHCGEAVPGEIKQRSPQYREIFPALDIGHTLAVNLEKSGAVGAYLGLTRSCGKRGYGQRHTALVGEIVPHLRRAWTIRKRYEATTVHAAFGMEIANHLPIAVAIADVDALVRRGSPLDRHAQRNAENLLLITSVPLAQTFDRYNRAGKPGLAADQQVQRAPQGVRL
jgi:hypothetical protein